jgi:hypothetical protein
MNHKNKQANAKETRSTCSVITSEIFFLSVKHASLTLQLRMKPVKTFFFFWSQHSESVIFAYLLLFYTHMTDGVLACPHISYWAYYDDGSLTDG